MVLAMVGVKTVMAVGLLVLLLLLAGHWWRQGRRAKPYRSPALSKLPPMPGSDYVAPPQAPIRPGGWGV